MIIIRKEESNLGVRHNYDTIASLALAQKLLAMTEIGCRHFQAYINDHGLDTFRVIAGYFVACVNKEAREKKGLTCYCFECGSYGIQLFTCLNCIYVGCSGPHIATHLRANKHYIALELSHGALYCIMCRDFVYDTRCSEIIATDLTLEAKDLQKSLSWQPWIPSAREANLLMSNTRRRRVRAHGTIGLRGLINLGSTCFMNCIVQALIHTPLLSDYFLSERHECNARSSLKCLVCEISRLFQEFYSGSRTPLSLHRLLHLIWNHAKHLAGYEQQDAHEFFIATLDVLHRHCIKAKLENVNDASRLTHESVGVHGHGIVGGCSGGAGASIGIGVSIGVSVGVGVSGSGSGCATGSDTSNCNDNNNGIVMVNGNDRGSGNINGNGNSNGELPVISTICNHIEPDTDNECRIRAPTPGPIPSTSPVSNGTDIELPPCSRNGSVLPALSGIGNGLPICNGSPAIDNAINCLTHDTVADSAAGKSLSTSVLPGLAMVPSPSAQSSSSSSSSSESLSITSTITMNNHFFNCLSQCNCIIDQIFTGMLQSDVVCQSCKGVSTTIDPFWDISLDLGETTMGGATPKTLIDCLERYTRAEHLGSSAKIKCSQCKSYQESTKQFSLRTLPSVASFHLKRFEHSSLIDRKISTFISFPVEFDMTPFMSEKNRTYGDFRYSLYAVINHVGTIDAGHYTAYVRHHKDTWVKCDDHIITTATLKQVLDSEGYLLFYHKNILEYD